VTVRNATYIVVIAACLFAAGCQPGTADVDEKIVYPGKASIEEAIDMLTLQRQNAQPFQASAECMITYRGKNGEDRHEPVRSAKMAFVPDEEIYFKGELVFKELRFGANETEFWFRVKADLDDFGDSYWWGLKADVGRCPEMLPVNPGCIAEAFGIVEVTPDWQLFYQDGRDVLSYYEEGAIKKRVYIDTRDYRIARIEYFDRDERIRVSMKLSDYSAQEDGITAPTRIEATSYDQTGQKEMAVLFELKHIRPLPPEKQKKKLFTRPGRDGYEHMYRLNENCEFTEEPNS